MFIAKDINELIGETPMLDITPFYSNTAKARVLSKLEFCNPTSIKDRGVHFMIKAALETGEITSGP